MDSQGILPSDSIQSAAKKNYRATHILGFIECIFISICLLLLLLNQYLSVVVDDYSPAYKIQDDGNDEKTSVVTPYSRVKETTRSFYPTTNSTKKMPSTMQSQKVFLPSTYSSPTKQTTDTTTVSQITDITETTRNDRAGIFNNSNTHNDSNLYTGEYEHEGSKVKKSALNYLKTKIARKHLKSDETIMESAMESPLNHSKIVMNLRSKQNKGWTDLDLFLSNLSFVRTSFKVKRDENVAGKNDNMETKLTYLLIMYPCCMSTMMILLMQMISRFTNDIMFKSTMIVLISTCIGLGVTIFATSVVESLSQRNSITILIAVASAIFIILEIIDFILLFTRT